jgi:negative regulator of flagellin synthesis FlgM
MNIKNSLDGSKSLSGDAPEACPTKHSEPSTAINPAVRGIDPATLSRGGCEVALTTADSEVRLDKVASIQAALASGTYNIPATEVASKMVDAMLENKH